MIQEILDEVLDTSLQPDNNPRYTIKDNNGRIINDNVQIEFKTPVVQNPTPLNRATLSNIQGDLYTQDRYNTPTYSGTAMTLNLPLTSYETGKIIKITAPTTLSNPTLNINSLGAKKINGKITKGEKVSLVYNGTSFNILFEIPSGIICMWSGSIDTIPVGWALCDGNNGTPNLLDRFIVGAGSTYAVGNTGGSNTVTLTVEEIPSHKHSEIKPEKGYTAYDAIGSSTSQLYVDAGETTSTGNTGGGQPHENRPPYYALAYIMKL